MNVLFFMSDQHHAGCLGSAGHPLVQTPCLDALAQQGVSFNRMYACSPICGPSRTSFFTGTYVNTHRHYQNDGDLFRKLPSIPSELKQAGYTAIQAGKDHLPPATSEDFDTMWSWKTWERYLDANGFGEVARTPGFDGFIPHTNRMTPTLLKQFTSYVSELPEEEHSEAWTASRVIDFLQSPEAKRQPFFIWCSFERPHGPYCPPANYDALYNPDDIPIDWEGLERLQACQLMNRPMIEEFWNVGSVRHDHAIFQKAVCRYLALVTFIDRQVGRVMDALAAQGLDDETIVVYTADHGDWAGNYGMLGKQIPGYEDIIRIPFIYRDPTRTGDDGRVVEGMYQNVDLFPSLLDRLDLPIPPTVQGQSFLPALDGYPGSSRRYIFSETSMEKTIASRDWKLTYYVRHPERGQLFRMGAHPDETTNRWDDPACAPVKLELTQQLLAWMIRCEQPDAMCTLWEEYLDTPWYRWLANQPKQVAIPEPSLRNEV
jgi:arylsulfatase A-like enzyme